MSALTAQRNLGSNRADSNSTMAKLSSGLRINKAGDDASGLAVSEKMRGQIRGLNQASKNTENGISFIQTTEGNLEGTQNMLHRLRELAVQSANGIYTDEDRAMIQVEVSQLVDEIDRVASHAQFNGMNMLTGRFAENGLAIQIGANMDQNETIKIATMTASALGLVNEQAGTISLGDAESANTTIGILDEAMKTVSAQRANLGAYQNRFEMAIDGINIASENLQASESRIRDTDMAKEVVDHSKNKILEQAGIAMLSQANVNSQSVLSLLQ